MRSANVAQLGADQVRARDSGGAEIRPDGRLRGTPGACVLGAMGHHEQVDPLGRVVGGGRVGRRGPQTLFDTATVASAAAFSSAV